jgi:hypothetical protein
VRSGRVGDGGLVRDRRARIEGQRAEAGIDSGVGRCGDPGVYPAIDEQCSATRIAG